MRRKTLQADRSAITKIELLACLLSVVGGVWIGAQYVGLDLHRAAYDALDETEMISKIPEDWRPVDPDCPTGDCPDEEELRAADLDRVRGELSTLRDRVANLQPGDLPVPGAMPKESEIDLVTRARTIAYWRSVAEVVQTVNEIQGMLAPLGRQVEAGPQSLASRRRALRYGKEAIELLPHHGVDARALETGVRVAEWLGQGAELLDAATRLAERQSIDGRAVPINEVRAQAEAEYHERSELVRRKVAEAAAYLAARYAVDFPPLGI